MSKKTKTDTFESFRKFVLDASVAKAETFEKADDDWPPIAIFIKSGKIAIMPLPMADDTEKAAMPFLLREVVKQFEPDFAAVILSVWALQLEGPMSELALSMAETLPIRNHPQRKEQLNVLLGDGTNYEIWMAPILRHESAPPTLGEWKLLPTEAKQKGRQANLLERAFAVLEKAKELDKTEEKKEKVADAGKILKNRLREFFK